MKFCLGEQSRWLSSVTKLRPTGVKTASEQSLPAVFPKSSMKINKPHFQGYSEYKGTRWGLQWHNRSAFPKWKAYELEKCFYSQMTKMIFKSKSDSAVKPSFFIKPWEHPYLLWEVWEPSLAHLFFFQMSPLSETFPSYRIWNCNSVRALPVPLAYFILLFKDTSLRTTWLTYTVFCLVPLLSLCSSMYPST